MADTRVVLPACPCPIRARLRRLAAAYTFTGCLLPQAYGKGDKARNEDEYRVQASPTTPAKLLMLTQGVGGLKEGLTSVVGQVEVLGSHSLCCCGIMSRQREGIRLLEVPSDEKHIYSEKNQPY